MHFQQPQTPSDARNAIIYKTDTFSRNNILFGLSVTFFILLIFLRDNFSFVISFLFVISLFHTVEKKVSDVIRSIYFTSQDPNESKKQIHLLLLWFVVSISLSAAFSVAARIFDFATDSFLDNFMKSLLLSAAVLFLSAALRSLLVGTSLVSINLIRRGFFAIFQRFFLFFLNFVTTPIWLHFLMSNNYKRVSVASYLVIKIGLFYMVLSDIKKCVILFISNKTRMFQAAPPIDKDEEVECPCCFSFPVEPIMLSCHHVSCYQCIYHWVSQKPICPMCRAPVDPPYYIEMATSYIPMHVFLAAF